MVGVAFMAIPTHAWADCFVKLVAYNCQPENEYFTAHTFGTYDIGCPLPRPSEGLMTLRDWSQNSITCTFKRPSYSTLGNTEIKFEVNSYFPGQAKGAGMGSSRASTSFNVDDEPLFSSEKKWELHSSNRNTVDYSVSVIGRTITYCRTVTENESVEDRQCETQQIKIPSKLHRK